MSNSSIGGGGLSSPVGETDGGTGQTSYTTGDILYASATDTLSKLGVPSFAGYPLYYDGTNVAYRDPSNCSITYEDFVSGGVYGNLNWASNSQNGSAFSISTESGHPGIALIGTGANSNGARRIALAGITLGGGVVIHQFIAKVNDLSTADDTFNVQLGLGNGGTATNELTNGCYFYYTHGTNSGNWVGKTASAGTRSTANSSNAVDTNWHEFIIVVNAAASSVSFYIDGTEIDNSPLTTNITSAEIGPSYTIDKDGGAVGTTARNVSVDYTWTYCVRA